MKRIYTIGEHKVLFETQENLIKTLDATIKKLEEEMMQIVLNHAELKQLFELTISVKGVGTILALYVLVYTEGFRKFKTYREFSSYCGIAPFPHQSGTSIKGRTKVSHLANKKMKTLLDLAAKSAIQYNAELRAYYLRRVEEGKNKRCTINIVRNKILARIFAVVKRKTPYVDTMKYLA